MGKVTIAQVTDDGFRAEQFGTPADWATADTGYLARLIADAVLWVQRKIDSTTYTAAAGSLLYALRMAELCYCRTQLWKRRAAFLDANAFTALEQGAAPERKQYLEQADQAWQCALDWLASAEAGGADDAYVGTGAVLVSNESGPYATDEDTLA